MPQAGTQKFLKYDRLGIIIIKVKIFWEGHKNLKNLPISFDLMYLVSSKKVWRFLWRSASISEL